VERKRNPTEHGRGLDGAAAQPDKLWPASPYTGLRVSLPRLCTRRVPFVIARNEAISPLTYRRIAAPFCQLWPAGMCLGLRFRSRATAVDVYHSSSRGTKRSPRQPLGRLPHRFASMVAINNSTHYGKTSLMTNHAMSGCAPASLHPTYSCTRPTTPPDLQHSSSRGTKRSPRQPLGRLPRRFASMVAINNSTHYGKTSLMTNHAMSGYAPAPPHPTYSCTRPTCTHAHCSFAMTKYAMSGCTPAQPHTP